MIYEFKLRGTKGWEETPIHHSAELDNFKNACGVARALCDNNELDVRMNEKGSSQGHYFKKPVVCNGKCRPTVMQVDKNCPIHGWIDEDDTMDQF